MAGKTVRELLVSLKVNSKSGMDSLARFGLAVDGVKSGLEILANTAKVATEATFGFIKEQTAMGDEIAKGARATGLGSREFQRMAYAMERSGVPMGNFVKSSQNLARNMRDAAISGGKGGFATSLEEIGISMKDLIGLPYEEKVGLIGERLQKLPTLAMRVAASQKLLGEEAGPKMASALIEGRAGLKALGDEAEELGLIMSDKALAAAESYQDALTNLDSVFTGLKRTIALEAAPQFKAIVDRIRATVMANRDLIRQNVREFFDKFSRLVMSIVENFDEWIDAIKEVVALFFKFVRGAGDIVGSLGGVANSAKLAGIAMAALGAAQLAALGPAGWITLLVAGLGGVALAYAEMTGAMVAARTSIEAGIGFNAEEQRALKETKEGRDILERAKIASEALLLPDERSRESAKRVLADAFKDAQPLIEYQRMLDETTKVQKKHTRASLGTEGEHMARLAAIGDTSEKKDKALDEAEILKLIDIAADQGKSLTGLIGSRKIEGGVPPVISIRNFQNRFETTINGADARTVEELAAMVEEKNQEMLREAAEAMTPAFVR